MRLWIEDGLRKTLITGWKKDWKVARFLERIASDLMNLKFRARSTSGHDGLLARIENCTYGGAIFCPRNTSLLSSRPTRA